MSAFLLWSPLLSNTTQQESRKLDNGEDIDVLFDVPAHWSTTFVGRNTTLLLQNKDIINNLLLTRTYFHAYYLIKPKGFYVFK